MIVKMKEKKVKPLDHLDFKSFSWKLMNYAISALICHDINLFLADVGLEVTGKILNVVRNIVCNFKVLYTYFLSLLEIASAQKQN